MALLGRCIVAELNEVDLHSFVAPYMFGTKLFLGHNPLKIDMFSNTSLVTLWFCSVAGAGNKAARW